MLANVGHISHIDIPLSSNSYPIKNGKTGELGQDRLEVRWEAVMFFVQCCKSKCLTVSF